MINRNKELAKNTLILGIGQLIPKFIALILLPLLTSYLSTSEYGDYDFIVSIADLVLPLLTLQIQQAAFRFLLSSELHDDREKYITASITYVLISSCVFFPVIILFLTCRGMDLLEAVMIALLYIFESMYSLLGQIVRGIGNNVKYSIGIIVYSVVNLLFSAALLIVFGYGLKGVIVALIFGYACADAFMFFSSGVLKYYHLAKFSKSYLRQLLDFCVPIVPSSIALWVVNLSDRLIIISFMGSAANGIYAVANKIPSLYSTAYNVFNMAWTETATKVSDDGKPEKYYSKLFNELFVFLIGVMLFLIAVTPIIFSLLVKGDFAEAINQVPIIYYGAFFNSLVNFYSGIYIALKRTKQVGVSSLMGAILNALINLTMISKIGLYAASISTAVSFLIIALYRAYDLNKVIKIDYDSGKIIIGFVAFSAASICLFLNNVVSMFIAWLIMLVYNFCYNRKLMVLGLKLVLNKAK